jgi:ligand-binding sensor domain-containing protein
MPSRRVLALLALTACGRIGFGEQSPSDGTTDGGTPRFPLVLPEGGTMLQVAIAPSGTWYVRTASAGVFRSRDEGGSWAACANGPPPTGIGVGPDNAVYLSGASMRVSTDECDSFTTLATARYSNHTAPAGAFMYALTDQGIERRSNGAWMQVLDVPGTPFGPFAARGGNTPLLVAGTNNSGVYTSDTGAAWTPRTTGFATPNIRGVAVGATKSYAIAGALGTSSGGISCGNADGTVWSICVSYGGVAIAVDPTDEDHVVAAVYDELAETTNGFMTTQFGRRGPGGLSNALVRHVEFSQTGALIAATNRGLFVSPPGPLAFQSRNSGLSAWTVERLLVDGDDLFVATDAGLARSLDGAELAIDTTGIPSDVDFNDVAIAPNGDVVGIGRGVWRSADRGVTWTLLYSFPDADDYHAYSIELGANGRIYAGSQRRLLVSDPPHTTWSPRSVGALSTKIDELVLHDGQLWAGTNMGLFVATVALDLSDVMSFVRIDSVGGGVESIALLADGGLLVGTSTGVWTSDATRTTWTERMTRATRTVLVHGEVLLAATSEGVFASRDGGASWTIVPESDGLGTSGLAIDPGSGELIYGAAGRGLVRAAIP